ncbi:MAG: helix-turn-helix transcriptional regulator [Eggerthellaceae bacterium]|nr:helix-turn-helix transcriptional regulator [Eggerthellaceae bacterium]
MAHDGIAQRDLSPRRIFGFASNQAFVFFLFYLGITQVAGEASSQVVGGAPVGQALSEPSGQFIRIDLLFILVFMVVGLFMLSRASSSARTRAFARPLLYLYAICAAVGSLLPTAFPDAGIWLFAAEGLVVGVPLACVLAAWGRTFGQVNTSISVVEVFLGSLVAALVCLAFAVAAPSDVVALAFRLLPLASVVNISVPADGKAVQSIALQDGADVVRMLSTKILAGTLLFGVAAGFVETCDAEVGSPAVPFIVVSFVLFAAFAIGALTLLLSDGFGKGAALNKSYRLAVFLMVAGALMTPVAMFAQSAFTGESLVLAGYLGLQVVFVSLFLVLAKITAVDAAHAFARGFTALFVGEALGVGLANVFAAILPFDQAKPVEMMIVGTIALLSYVFFFTERDFDALTQIVTVSDDFEERCALMVERFRLSKREAEILPYAVRGRTSERIAREMVVTKSTVDTHLRRIYAKCDVHSRQELIDLFESVR